MSNLAVRYNERSWAIDLIGYLKYLASEQNRSIKDAGGEQTVKAEGGSLFPDVLLFGDRSTARILQGWELKMPDTGIDDVEFRENAKTKAIALGLDSFLLWNVSHAHLYIKNQNSNEYVRSQTWSDLADVTTRSAVAVQRERWEALALKIFSYLNDLFDRGSLHGRQFIEAYKSGGITALIMENSGQVALALTDAARRNVSLRSEMTLWWDRYKAEYGGSSMEQVLAQAVISNWIGKIIFAHILREKDRRAQRIEEINDQTTPQEALVIFKSLSEDCNFWTIFSDSIGLEHIPDIAWSQLKQFNNLLSDLRVGAVDQGQLSGILEATVEVAVRKLRGQYPTPIELAHLLISLCVRDTVEDKVFDPCCGSGTIVRAALEQKVASEVSEEKISASIFASDQDPQAIQIATFALAKPNMMHMPMRIFQRDAFDLTPNLEVEFRNPSNGSLFSEKLGYFDAITSNLPFVAQVGRRQYGNAIDRTIAMLGEEAEGFTRRADVSAYLPFVFYPLLNEKGRLGIIITNAWLGTDWGDAFYNLFNRFYDLKSVVTSGAGRWFQNSEVVTNILIMEKKADLSAESGNIKFVVLKRRLEEMSDIGAIQVAAAQIELGRTQNDTMTIRSISPDKFSNFKKLGLGGNAQFVDCDWILELPLIALNERFEIRRGERRGMNDLFYPRAGHGIETDYIKPLAKSPAHFERLSSPAAKEAFSCSRTKEELRTLGHTGALNWIARFEGLENIERLATGGQLWYEMKADALTDLVMFINYGDRLFVGRVNPPAFADQRLVRLMPKHEIDIDLYHALLNSTISMFIIEGMGFGRGLGALDLSKDRIENYFHMLDADKLDQKEKSAIKQAFAPLLQRDILNIADELEQKDRQHFDEVVKSAFGLSVEVSKVYDCLLSLVEIRATATD